MNYSCPKCGRPLYCVSTASIPPHISYHCLCGFASKTIREPFNLIPLPIEWYPEEDGLARKTPIKRIDD
jgi:hypothetical protein